MVHIIKPFDPSPDRDLGKVYNQSISLLPDHSICCVMDLDCMFLTPDAGNTLNEYAEVFGSNSEIGILTSWTNRIHALATAQLFSEQNMGNADILDHIEIARTLRDNEIGLTVIDNDIPISGFLLMFRKETWAQVGGFDEGIGCLSVDNKFVRKVRGIGMKVARMNRIYIFHLYRMWTSVTDKSHLQPGIEWQAASQVPSQMKINDSDNKGDWKYIDETTPIPSDDVMNGVFERHKQLITWPPQTFPKQPITPIEETDIFRMYSHTAILNYLIERYGLRTYLEIGVGNGNNFRKVSCDFKIGVDPDPNSAATNYETSDEFFEKLDMCKRHGKWPLRIHKSKDDYIDVETFDCIFLDGRHEFEFIKRDFENALKYTNDNSMIIIHDTNPIKIENTAVPRGDTAIWNGDVFRFAANLNKYSNIGWMTFEFDSGTTCIWKTGGEVTHGEFDEITWEYFDANRKELLRIGEKLRL